MVAESDSQKPIVNTLYFSTLLYYINLFKGQGRKRGRKRDGERKKERKEATEREMER